MGLSWPNFPPRYLLRITSSTTARSNYPFVGGSITEFITPNLVGFIALALFMWEITRDISGVEKRLTEKIDGVTSRLSELGERVVHIEGLLEGERKAALKSSQQS